MADYNSAYTGAEIDAAIGKTQVAGFDLSAIAATKAVTAVDVFVYDTSKDSDGGAWRKRTQHTSWYNETLNTATRGSRREFPAVAVIVAEAAKVTIYDGDDPSLPMWMVLYTSAGGTLSVFALNGRIYAARSIGADREYNFASDTARSWYSTSAFNGFWTGGIAERTTTGDTGTLITSSDTIVNYAVNDVAMTVLPDAPIDPATGLPVPTIAVATDGGVSVIKDDGTVVDSGVAAATNSVSFDSGLMVYSASASARLYADIAADISSDGFGPTYRFDNSGSNIPLMLNGGSNKVSNGGGEAFSYDAAGLSRYRVDQANDNDSMVAYTTSTYNTGWMNGDIKGAFLSDTDDTDLVAATPLDDDFTSYADQDAVETAGWTFGTGWTFDAANDQCDLDTSVSGAGVITSIQRTISTTSGKTYVATAVVSNVTNVTANDLFLRADNVELQNSAGQTVGVAGDGTYQITFVASSNSTPVQVRTGGTCDGDETASLDSFSVKLADADRSVNG